MDVINDFDTITNYYLNELNKEWGKLVCNSLIAEQNQELEPDSTKVVLGCAQTFVKELMELVHTTRDRLERELEDVELNGVGD